MTLRISFKFPHMGYYIWFKSGNRFNKLEDVFEHFNKTHQTQNGEYSYPKGVELKIFDWDSGDWLMDWVKP